MKKYTIITILCFLCFGLLTSLCAQETIPSTGGEAFGSGGSVSYTVGQVSYQTHAGANGSLAEGVQQPYEISIVTEIEQAKSINLSVSAYPNPTIDYLILEVKDFEFLNLHFQLYDMKGKLLQSELITGNQTRIDMSNLVPSAYFVKVIQAYKEVKTFKIIKN